MGGKKFFMSLMGGAKIRTRLEESSVWKSRVEDMSDSPARIGASNDLAGITNGN